jgi:hypothetical protein
VGTRHPRSTVRKPSRLPTSSAEDGEITGRDNIVSIHRMFNDTGHDSGAFLVQSGMSPRPVDGTVVQDGWFNIALL